MYEPWKIRSFLCSAEGESTEGGGTTTTETAAKPADTPAPATAAAAQAALADSAKPATLLTETEKPTEPAQVPFNAEKLTIPEGFEPSKEMLESFGKIAEGLPHDRAQALVDLYAKTVQSDAQKSADFWTETRNKWEAEAKGWKDEEVTSARFSAGDKTLSGLEAMVQTVRKVLDNPQLTDPKFKEALEFTGMGSNPAAIRTLYRWANQLVEGGPSRTGGVPNTVDAKDDSSAQTKSAAQILYPSLPTG